MNDSITSLSHTRLPAGPEYDVSSPLDKGQLLNSQTKSETIINEKSQRDDSEEVPVLRYNDS